MKKQAYRYEVSITKTEIIDLFYCRSEDQIVDIMTKPLKVSTFHKLRRLLRVYVAN